MREVVREKW
jgi:hypothetical protein